MEACRVSGFDELGKILSNCQMNANELNTWRAAMLADLTNLAKFSQIGKPNIEG